MSSTHHLKNAESFRQIKGLLATALALHSQYYIIFCDTAVQIHLNIKLHC